MPSFSFTAPHITPEQEREERESLAEEMRQELFNDLYGVDQPSEWEEPMEVPEEMLEQLDEAINKLPERQKKEYMEARTCAPKLVQYESDPRMFLRCEKLDCEAAAARLAYYWKIRRRLFGTERAYRPMTLLGAMAEDRKLFESGLVAVHPKDDKGRVVLFFDRIRAIKPLASRDEALRCLFFMIHILVSEQPSMQTAGCVCLLNIKGYDLYKHFDRIMSKHLSILLLQCMPMKAKALHLLAGSANGVMSLVLPSMKQVMGKHCRLRMTVHSGTDDKMLETLAPFGLTARNMSDALSGDFTHEDFVTWFESWLENKERLESISTTECDDSLSEDEA